MITDQAEKLRLLMKRAGKTARIITVTSGKGGVGKSNVAANLALCLMASGKKVVLLDADLGLANLDVLLNVRPRYTLAQVISGKRHLDEIIQTGPGGLRLVCGASGLAELADLSEFERQRIIQEISILEHKTDIILIDTSAGISRNVIAFCDAAHHTLVVTTAEPTSITDAYAVIKQITRNHTGVKISLLVNMADSQSAAKTVYQRLADTAGRFLSVTIYYAGYILRDEHVISAVNQSEPVVLAHPRCQASYCFLALASKLCRAAEPAAEEDGFFRKVVNWFI